jgi:hypothetical protein
MRDQDCCNRRAVRLETATESYGGGGGGGGLGGLGGGGFGFPIRLPSNSGVLSEIAMFYCQARRYYFREPSARADWKAVCVLANRSITDK